MLVRHGPPTLILHDEHDRLYYLAYYGTWDTVNAQKRSQS